MLIAFTHRHLLHHRRCPHDGSIRYALISPLSASPYGILRQLLPNLVQSLDLLAIGALHCALVLSHELAELLVG